MPISSNSLWQMLSNIFSPQPEAYSRATRTPIEFTNLEPGTTAQTLDDGNLIQLPTSARRPTLEDLFRQHGTMRHETTHVMVDKDKPQFNTKAVQDLVPAVKFGLRSIGYEPEYLNEGTNLHNEALGFYASRKRIPGLNNEDSERFVRGVLGEAESPRLKKHLGIE